jgi:hypothetical protein
MEALVKPAKYNTTCPQGATYDIQFTYKINKFPVNLTGYSARMQVRESYSSPNTLVSLSTGSGITLGESAGTINILISAVETAAFTPNTYIYDIELVSPNQSVIRIVEGSFIVTPEVTR